MTSWTKNENKINFPEDILKKSLQKIYGRVTSSLDPKGVILGNLFAQGTITLEEKRQIEGLPGEGRGAELIDMLLKCQRPNAVTQFLEILHNSEETACNWIPDEVIKVATTLTIESSSGRTRITSSQSIVTQHGKTNAANPMDQKGTTGSGGLVNSDATEEKFGASMESFPKRQCIVLGVFHVVTSLVALVAAIISEDGFDKSGFAAILCIISGFVSVMSGLASKEYMAKGQAVLSIISACVCVIIMAFAWADLEDSNSKNETASALLIAMGFLGSISSIWTASIGFHYAYCKCCCPFLSK